MMNMEKTATPPPAKQIITPIPKAIQHLSLQQISSSKWAVALIVVLAYLYTSAFFDSQHLFFFPLAIGLISLVEWLRYRWGFAPREIAEQPSSNWENILIAILTLLQALAISIWGFHPQLEIAQYLLLHASFILYVASRNNRLIQGRLGILFWSDALYNTLYLPFKQFVLALEVLGTETSDKDTTDNKSLHKFKHLGMIILSLVIAILLIGFVVNQLEQVSQDFADLVHYSFSWFDHLGQVFFDAINQFFSIPRMIVSLPISLWLFGLIGGSLIESKKRHLTPDQFSQNIRPYQLFPSLTTYIIAGSLCIVYALFFAIGLGEITSIQTISAPDASNLAVSGFWQLVRVSLLNFTVLAGLYFITKPQVLFGKASRWVLTFLFSFAFLFALLAAWKLFGIYIHFYGPTPLRLLSGWFITVLLTWCLLVLVRLHQPIQAIRWGILYAFISFTILVFVYGFLLV